MTITKKVSKKQQRKELIDKIIQLSQELDYAEYKLPHLVKELLELKPTKKEIYEIEEVIDTYKQ